MSSEPSSHRVIRASAGSGKTHQLTNRYLALLAARVEPDTILATTFTRKAAGEILDRVLERLAKAASDIEEATGLTSQIDAEEIAPVNFTALLRRVLRDLHRVRIGTLDSFYVAMGGTFNFELGLPAGWSICEEYDDALLREEAIERVLEKDDLEMLTALYTRLSRGQARRGVQQELLEIVTNLYDIHQQTLPSVWNKVIVPAPLDAERLDAVLESIEAFDLSKDSRMRNARDADVKRARSAQWEELLTTGLMSKVFSGKDSYHSKPIPHELISLYEQLIPHGRSVLVQPLAEQTGATCEFLDRFHRELWALKQASGQLRFGEVTQALADVLRRQSIQPQSLAFRLDGAVEHVLLDEFQDTSLPQWQVLRPIAAAVTAASAPSPRSFFCVGDVKQAIYGWRGGIAEIFNTLPDALGHLREDELFKSWRSAPPVIEVVNKVFGNLKSFQAREKNQQGLEAWADRFTRHETVKEHAGYVCLHTGPKQDEGEGVADQRGRHCKEVAAKISDLVRQAPGRSIGVLCRKNDIVARMIYELRQKHIDASEEGGNPLTDSPAVEVMLSLFTLADHPGHSVAWFHLQNSPLQEELASFSDPHTLAQHLRRDLLASGYGRFAQNWAVRLAPACGRRDLSRLQQLVETAYSFERRSTLRADDFVRWVRQERVPDPSGANARVMTIHAAKGLEFDAVVLPELDAPLSGRPPAFVAGRDPRSLEVNFVCRYAKEDIQKLLAPEEQRAFNQDRQQSVEESLSCLYVAMTRAIYALYLFIPGRRNKRQNDAWYQLLRSALTPNKEWPENSLLYEHGDADWFKKNAPEKTTSVTAASERPQQIFFRSDESPRRRGLEHVAPSGREGEAKVALNRLFNPSEGTGMAAGTLYHAWFEIIDWLDEGPPTDEALRAAADKYRTELPPDIWIELDQLLSNFHRWLELPEICCVLKRSAYKDSQQPGFPTSLAPIWSEKISIQEVEQERRFLARDGEKFWNGFLDRIVWLTDGERLVAADVIDWKTDAIPPGDDESLKARVEHYRPQLEAYRRALTCLAQLPPERIATRLVFTFAGHVEDLS